MKKILTILLSLCLLASMAVSFAVGASAAEEIDVTVGQSFEWNDQSADQDAVRAWLKGNGSSPDGLWKYQVYVLAQDRYLDTVLANSSFYAWNATPGDKGLGYARARSNGKNFHPAEAADIVKVFTCPSGGTVTIDTTVARQNEWVTGSGTPSSFAVYLEDTLVYPTSGEYETLTSTTPRNITFDLDVAQNQRIYIHIGCVDGDQSSDGVDMSNTITYKAVNDNVAEIVEDVTTTDGKTPPSVSVPDFVDDPTTDNNKNTGSPGVTLPTGDNDDSSNTGLIIGIVAAVVVVAAVAVVIVIKKKKQ